MSANFTDAYRTSGILGVLRVAHLTAQEIRQDLPPTGWTWKRPKDHHPGWCARDHTCTVRPEIRGPMSEHRSQIGTWVRTWGKVIATRVRALQGNSDRLEVRVQVKLSATSDALALAQSIQLPLVIEAAVSTLLVELEVQARTRAEIRRNHQAAVAAGRPWPAFDETEQLAFARQILAVGR